VPNRNAGRMHLEIQQVSERLKRSMCVPLFFSELAPSEHPGRKEMFETLNARQRPKFQAIQFEILTVVCLF
jgi:hypothetical protein